MNESRAICEAKPAALLPVIISRAIARIYLPADNRQVGIPIRRDEIKRRASASMLRAGPAHVNARKMRPAAPKIVPVEGQR